MVPDRAVRRVGLEQIHDVLVVVVHGRRVAAADRLVPVADGRIGAWVGSGH